MALRRTRSARDREDGPPEPRRPLLRHQTFAVPSVRDWTSLLTGRSEDFTGLQTPSSREKGGTAWFDPSDVHGPQSHDAGGTPRGVPGELQGPQPRAANRGVDENRIRRFTEWCAGRGIECPPISWKGARGRLTGRSSVPTIGWGATQRVSKELETKKWQFVCCAFDACEASEGPLMKSTRRREPRTDFGIALHPLVGCEA